MPIYKNQRTGKQVEVLPGTRLPKVYVEVKRSAATSNKPANDKNPKDETKPKSDEKSDKKVSDAKPVDEQTNTSNKPANDKK